MSDRYQAGALVADSEVIQKHQGLCSRCRRITWGILLVENQERVWFVAQQLTNGNFQIHACKDGQIFRSAGVPHRPRPEKVA